MPKDVETYKTFVVRSIIYGAALMIDNGEIENCQKSYDYAEMIISRSSTSATDTTHKATSGSP